MGKRFLKNIVILGGGTAGWMTAAGLSRFISPLHTKITLVESNAIGTVGVGEATIPHIRVYNEMLGISEQLFMEETKATYKLGIRFKGWGSDTGDYYHPFGDHGYPIKGIPFHHYWLKAKLNSSANLLPFDKYSLANEMARQERFVYPSADANKVESTYSYAYHLDAGAYARLLRNYSESKGVKRIEGEVNSVRLDSDSGHIKSLKLASGEEIEGDFFIDCSGFRGRLIAQALGVPFVSWKSWLPCDRAVALPSSSVMAPVPYTQSSATSAGWCWQIPLKHRIGNGHVYSSAFLSNEEAEQQLLAHLPGSAIASPRLLEFEAGMRARSWEKNCVAIGLSSGFLEPLESTSIYLIQVGIYKLLELLPVSENFLVDSVEFNRLVRDEYEKVRDFIILHYHANQRSEPFWQYCASMVPPDSLQHKMELFKKIGHVVEYETGLFMQPSWLAVYLGQGIIPNKIDYRVSILPEDFEELLARIPEQLAKTVAHMPSHFSSLTISPQQFKQNYVQPRASLYGIRK